MTVQARQSSTRGRDSTQRIYLNMAFVGQRVTGQQRFATEISRRISAQSTVIPVFVPTRLRSRALRWLWVQLVLPLKTWRGTLVSLTARAPLAHPRHVVVVHDLFPLTNPEWFSPLFAGVQATLLRAHLRFARTIAVVSEPMAQEVRRRARRGMDVVLVPNAPSEIFLNRQESSSGLLERLKLVPEGYLLVVGSMDPRKNLPRIVEAYDALSDDEKRALPLVVVGSGSDIFGDTHVEWPSSVIRAGYVRDDELVDLYSNARATVFGSLAEGFGLPVVEAAACGSPLLLSNIEVFRWLCGGTATYFDPLSTASIAGVLRLVLEATPQPEHVGLREVSSRFSWERSADQLLDAVAGPVTVGSRVG